MIFKRVLGLISLATILSYWKALFTRTRLSPFNSIWGAKGFFDVVDCSDDQSLGTVVSYEVLLRSEIASVREMRRFSAIIKIFLFFSLLSFPFLVSSPLHLVKERWPRRNVLKNKGCKRQSREDLDLKNFCFFNLHFRVT